MITASIARYYIIRKDGKEGARHYVRSESELKAQIEKIKSKDPTTRIVVENGWYDPPANEAAIDAIAYYQGASNGNKARSYAGSDALERVRTAYDRHHGTITESELEEVVKRGLTIEMKHRLEE